MFKLLELLFALLDFGCVLFLAPHALHFVVQGLLPAPRVYDFKIKLVQAAQSYDRWNIWNQFVDFSCIEF